MEAEQFGKVLQRLIQIQIRNQRQMIGSDNREADSVKSQPFEPEVRSFLSQVKSRWDPTCQVILSLDALDSTGRFQRKRVPFRVNPVGLRPETTKLHLPINSSPRLKNRKFNMALGHVLGGGTSINAMV